MLSVCTSLTTAPAAAAASGRTHKNNQCLVPSYNPSSTLRLFRRQRSPATPPNYTISPTARNANGIRCAATSKVVAPPKTLQHSEHDQECVHLELCITKSSSYTWPLQHKLVLRLVSSTQVDPGTGEGIVSSPTIVCIPPGEATVKLQVDILVPQSFDMPAALLLESPHSEEFFLDSVSWSTPTNASQLHHFWCKSWVTETLDLKPRIFFTNEVFLPSQTPPGLTQLRQMELNLLQGDGTGRRRLGERIYDYDVYNDLGNPDMDRASARPVLGGSQELPYPRRCRTGREHTATDPKSEAPELDGTKFYVPRDEQFSPTKQLIFDQTLQQSALAVALHLSADLDAAAARSDQQTSTFNSLEEIYGLYGDSFPKPPIIQEDKDAWWTDEEFARQRLAGLNPLVIERVKAFPLVSSLDPKIYGPATSAITAQHIEHNLEGLKVEKAVSDKRLFVLDYHDALLPALEQVNSSADESNVYASRTLFFLTSEGILKPIAIELSSPPARDHKSHHGAVKRVFTPPPSTIQAFLGNDESAWLWHLAKAHVVINDTGYHQLISHWLRTHASMEPFVIATHRQLSALHPINRLLLPHLKDTMGINGQARKSLINSDGIIESTFFPREFCMKFSSLVYKNWRFDEQGLPQDLIKRGMAEKTDKGLTLTIKDYPYAVDGLELWEVLESWVQNYLDIYYQNDQDVQGDDELKKWWNEIKEIGHGDHREAKCWGAMKTKEELKQALVTIIWVASGHHAAVNFGQYAYAGFMPNSPSMGRRSIPDTGGNDPDLQELREGPERFFLSALSTRFEAVAVMGTLLLLSHHIEEEFLGEATNDNWTSDARAISAFRDFGSALKQVEANIDARNQDPSLNKNRHGPAQMPYKLLFPSSEQGLTYKGVPNSVAI